MSDLEKKLAALSPEQRRLLEQRLKQKAAGERTPPQETADGLTDGATGLLQEMPGKAAADGTGGTAPSGNPVGSGSGPGEGMQFSLIFFSGDGSSTAGDKYRLLIESAKFADRHGFSAVWTPERHFQAIGGLYPNPSVLSAGLATITSRIQLRAGSVVLPLHHPLRVAEEWSVVDNLSQGRVAISVATGWHPADFVLNPDIYEDRKQIMFDNLDLIRRLWRGESARFKDIAGGEAEVKVLPRPVQPELPIFCTASGNPATWIKAGELGVNILCSLANHPADALKERIELYRSKRREHGHDPDAGIVSVMLHTYVGETDSGVKEQVRGPLRDYLSTFLGQYDTLNPYKDDNAAVKDVLDNEKESLITFAFEKYFQMSSLMGSKQKCAKMIERLQKLGVNEVACLLDFGLEFEQIMQGLEHLNELKSWFTPVQETVSV
ncbi:natural product biosynthesis luciferase-like monooxygenase protein [Paenibacillus mucilaginosus]|uniref:LLM class flavin-dependent oxidoreductase n=1 Tax=Paenibacillus mucilaginosus TaxID=61624 RepID=UPI003D201640